MKLTADDVGQIAAALLIGLVVAIIVTACASEPVRMVTSDRPLSARELKQIDAEVKSALPPACETTSLDVRGEQAHFEYACMRR